MIRHKPPTKMQKQPIAAFARTKTSPATLEGRFADIVADTMIIPEVFVMKRLIYIIPVTAIGLLTLVGCNSPQESATQSPAVTETTAATTVSKTPSAMQGGFGTLVSVVSNTKTAVSAGNFDKAQQEFDQFENSWSKVEDGVKTKSSKTYNAIEDAATQVKGALKAKDKAKALKGLQTLDTNIATVSKG